MQTPFQNFITRVLSGKIAGSIISLITTAPALIYFERAFTDESFVQDIASKAGAQPLSYQVLEKIGDKAYNFFFQKWLFNLAGHIIDSPQFFADAEKNFASNKYMNTLAQKMGFDEYIKVAKGIYVTEGIRSDVFEAFVAALIITGDRFIQQGVGNSIAEIFVFKLLDETTRELINPEKKLELSDYRTRINEIYTFAAWPTPPDYIVSSDATAKNKSVLDELNSALGVTIVQSVNTFSSTLRAPNTANVPEKLRGVDIGAGKGNTEDEARENAAKAAFEYIQATYKDYADIGKSYKNVLEKFPILINKVEQILNERKEYETISFKTARLIGTYIVQLRVKKNGIFFNSVLTKGTISEEATIVKAVQTFIDKAEKQENLIKGVSAK